MGKINCCNVIQKSVSFDCDPPAGYLVQQLDYLHWCKNCKRSVLQVTRVNYDEQVSYFRRTEQAAQELFERMRSSIRYKITAPVVPRNGSKFWLGYSEYGQRKRCYSNFSALQPVGESKDLPRQWRLQPVLV